MNTFNEPPRRDVGPGRIASAVFPMRKLLVVAGLFAALLPSARAVDYYVDSTSTGTNQGTYANPWKSLAWNAPVNTVLFQPGDRILFRKGRTYNGTLFFGGGGNGGTSTSPLVIDSYAVPGDPDVKPIIAGGGVAGATIELKNKAYTTVQNLEITNWPADPTVEGSSPGVRMGIRVTAYSEGAWSGIKILNNTVRKIRGITARGGLYGNAAIHAVIADTSVNARWDDFLIEGNDLSDNTCIGILFKSPSYYTMTNTAQWATNVRIRENTFQNVGADHILLNGCESPVVEYNKGYDAGLYGTRGYEMIAGMWTCYKTQNTLFQYNEVAYTVNEFQNGISGDSKAFDVDYGTQGNHIFQYNYTHHNEGGVLIIMPRENGSDPINDWIKTTIYRYNLSVNDGRNTGSCSQFGIWPVQGKSSAHIYNNVFYSTLPEGYKFSDVTAAYYTNNIFYVPAAIYPSGPRFSNNCYYGHTANVNDPYKVVANPKFVSPFPAGAGGDGDNIANTDIFKLQSDSPCINAGKAITQAPLPAMDYWYNSLNVGRPDIGAHEHPTPVVGTTAAPTTTATTVYEDPLNLPSVAYSASWTRTTNDGAFSGGNQSVASVAGQWVEVTFTGTNLSLYGKRSPGLGKMNVSIDGGPTVGVADCYWPIDQYRTELYRVTGLTNAQHKVRFTLNGKSTFSTGTYVGLDYFETLPVTPHALPVVTVIDNLAGTHTGTWDTTGTDKHYYGRTRSISTTVGNYVEYIFTGTGVRLYGPKAVDRGKMTITINGANPVLVDQFSPVSYPEHIDHRMKLFEVNGLAQGTYTLRATVAESGGKQVVIDWLEGLVGGYVPPAPVIVDTNGSTPSLAYAGTWTHAADALFHNATKSVANSNNASVQLTFTGTKASLYVKTAPGLGRLNISVNNGPPTLVDCNTTGTAYKVKIFETAVLSPGTHTIKATVYDPGLTNKYVGVDYFEYQP
jgi:hypothetical protein